MAKKPAPTIQPQPLAREVKTYRWPGQRGVVRQIGHNVFLPLLSINDGEQECFLLEADAPACFTLEQALAWMAARIVEAKKPEPIEIYVPPGKGKLQA